MLPHSSLFALLYVDQCWQPTNIARNYPHSWPSYPDFEVAMTIRYSLFVHASSTMTTVFQSWRKSIPRVVITHSKYLFVSLSFQEMITLSQCSLAILPTIPRREQYETTQTKDDHAHGSRVAWNESRSMRSWIYLTDVSCRSHRDRFKELTNGAETPDTFPSMMWMPIAVVRFPYLGMLVGCHEAANPTAV